METNGDGRQNNSDRSKESKPENESASVASVTSMDSSSSIASSSKDVKANDLRNSSISEVVEKSKKAAFSLWTLLHAKVGGTKVLTNIGRCVVQIHSLNENATMAITLKAALYRVLK